MKRLAILAVFVLVSQACHRKEYPLFTSPSGYQHDERLPITRVGPPVLIATTERSSQSSPSISTPSSIDHIRTVTSIKPVIVVQREQKLDRTKQPTTWVAKQSRKKTMDKATKVENPAATSLTLSIVGLLTTILTVSLTWPIWLIVAGLLAGVGGFVLGLSTLRRIRSGVLPASDKGKAIAGLVLGAMTSLACLAILYIFLVVATSSGV